MEPTEPTTPRVPADPVRPAEQAQPARPIDPGEPVQSVQPVGPVPRIGRMRPIWYAARELSPAYRSRHAIHLALGIVETLVLIRFVFKVFAANPNAAFTSFIYALTYPLVVFFQGVFPEPSGNGSVLELSSLLAMAIYALLAWVIVRVIRIAHPRRPTSAA